MEEEETEKEGQCKDVKSKKNDRGNKRPLSPDEFEIGRSAEGNKSPVEGSD